MYFRQIGWLELCISSRISNGQTKFCLVLHTEGLVNDRIVRSLRDLGKQLHGIRPLLTVISPLCPQYQIDPVKQPIRVEFAFRETKQSIERDFKSKIEDLSSYYDIGYHGHFFAVSDGVCRPAFDPEIVRKQFMAECDYLREVGSKPYAYAGGWWYMAPHLENLLQSNGFSIDTTLNDIRTDSFNQRQPYPETPLGQPFRLQKDVIEVPTIRSDANLFKILSARTNTQKLIPVSLHDYNLIAHPFIDSFRRIVRKLLEHERVVSISDFLPTCSPKTGTV